MFGNSLHEKHKLELKLSNKLKNSFNEATELFFTLKVQDCFSVSRPEVKQQTLFRFLHQINFQ